MANCMGITKAGDLCTRVAQANGWCNQHQPVQRKTKDRKEQITLVNSDGTADVEEQRSINSMIASIKDLETLKEAQKRVIQGLVDGTVDPKVGSAISQMLKHHADLIDKTKPDDDEINDTTKQRITDKAKAMTMAEAWNFLQDFNENMKAVVGAVKKEQREEEKVIDVEPIETPDIVLLEEQDDF